MKYAKKNIDILKGILIISVILGHCNLNPEFLWNLIFWYHMPLFFIVSGYLLNPNENIIVFIQKKFTRLFIPYLSWFVINSILEKTLLKRETWYKFFVGGRKLGGVYWFIPCLFFSIIIFSIILKYFKTKWVIFFTIFFGIIATLESNFYIPRGTNTFDKQYIIIWSLDVCLLAITYIAIGYYFKNIIDQLFSCNIRNSKFIFGIVFSTTIIGVMVLFWKYDIYRFQIDMKYVHYYNYFLLVLIPMCFLIFFITIIKIISCSNLISNSMSYTGQASMVIMYIHIYFNHLFSSVFEMSGFMWIYQGMFSLVASLMNYKLISQSKILTKVLIKGILSNSENPPE
jgi:fucose 4-O-acetylase-like acetyltransferase